MTAPLVLFAPASGPRVGGGHVMRGAALACALEAQGAACAFAVTDHGATTLERFFPARFAAHRVARADTSALAALARALRPRAVVADDYRLAALDERALAAPGRVLMAIDDLADRAHAVDLVLDAGYGRSAAEYAPLAPGAALLLGPRHALLRPAFAHAPRRRGEALERLFVSFGLSDVDGVAERVVGLIRARAPGLVLDVALGSDAPSRPALESRARSDAALRLHLDATDVAALMARADAAVGAGGSGVWERCAAGLASVAVVVADNQRPLVEALARDAAILSCDLFAADFEARFLAAFDALRDPSRRAVLAARGRELCDGRGAERAAQALLTAIRDRS